MSDPDNQIKEWTASARKWDGLSRNYMRIIKFNFVKALILICYSIVSVALQQTTTTLIWAASAFLIGVSSVHGALRDRISRRYCQKNAATDRMEIEQIKEHVRAMAALDEKFIEDIETLTATMEKSRAKPTTH